VAGEPATTVGCLDVGSVKRNAVGWAVLGSRRIHGNDLHAFVNALCVEIDMNRRLALGFECPLYVPRRNDPINLTSKREGEIGVNWCGGPGGAVLATGLVQARWVLDRLAERHRELRGTTRWAEFSEGKAELLIWEAFVTSKAGPRVSLAKFPRSRGRDHERDALAGALVCESRINSVGLITSDLGSEDSSSLVALHLIASGLAIDLGLVGEQCTVVMARKPS
jgi:hypothetical protein